MKNFFVEATCEVHCKWSYDAPRYRLFVNDELFAERTFLWPRAHLLEKIVLNAPPGHYIIRTELVDDKFASIRMRDLTVKSGPAVIGPDGRITIYSPEDKNAIS